MAIPEVILIGGAPGAGKTTLGKALAARLDAVSQTADDLQTAAMAVTTPETHPGLHVMSQAVTGLTSPEYFTRTPPEKLITDATAQHEAVWPAIRGIIRKHSIWAGRIVIDGWYIRPRHVIDLDLDNVASFWLVVDEPVLEQRESGQEFYQTSSNPTQMLQNFLARSYWYNNLIKTEATRLNLQILHQNGTATVQDLCQEVMDHLNELR